MQQQQPLEFSGPFFPSFEMNCPRLSGRSPVATSARPRTSFGEANQLRLALGTHLGKHAALLKNPWRLFRGVPPLFRLPSSRFTCMASGTIPGDSGFGRSTSFADEAPRSFYPWPDKQRPRVCILGGGFGGLHTALRLDSLLWPSGKKPQFVRDSVKLICPSNHLRREPEGSCTGGVVYLESGTAIEYDWLVIALGAEAKNSVTIPGSEEYTFRFMTLEDALRVEKKLKTLESTRYTEGSSPIQVAIVGLGYNGAALAATISERLKNKGTVTAINAQATICPVAPPGIRDASVKVIESRNIELLFGYYVSCIREACTSESDNTVTDSRICNDDHKKLLLDLQPVQRGLQRQTLKADLVLWTVGYASQIPRLLPPDGLSEMPLADRGQIETEETLQVKGHPRIFAIGDSAAIRDPSGELFPDTAQAAFEQAHFAAQNIWSVINYQPLLPFRFNIFGEFMSLGRNDAAISINFLKGLTLEGPIAHAVRKVAYCIRMPTHDHRVRVGISWFTKATTESTSFVQNAVINMFAKS